MHKRVIFLGIGALTSAACASFNDLRHQVQPVLGRRSDFLVFVAAIRLGHHIVAQTQRHAVLVGVDRVIQGFDASRIDCAHLFDQGKNAI